MTTAEITVASLNLTSVTGSSSSVKLHSPLTVGCTISPSSLCRLVVPRLPVSPSSCVMFGMLLDEALEGISVPHSYAEVGAAMGRGAHTAIRSAAELRGLGLLFTTRAGNGRLNFICTPLIRWAESVVGCRIAQDAQERASDASANSGSDTARESAAGLSASVCVAPESVPAETVREMAYHDEINDDRPDWPAVPGNWRGLYGIPLPEDDMMPSMAVPLHVKPWLGPVPYGDDGNLDMDRLLRMPYQLVRASGDDSAIHEFCQAKGDRNEGPIRVASGDPDVDASEERDAEAALAGDVGDDDGEFRFGTGSEVAATDVGSSVRMNPDL